MANLDVISSVPFGSGSIFITVPPDGGDITSDIIITINKPNETPTQSPSSGAVSGKILDKNGVNPVSNAFVVFYSLSTLRSIELTGAGDPDFTTFSDQDGKYSFSNVPLGLCRIEFWMTENDYISNPSIPLGSISGTVSIETVIDIRINNTGNINLILD